jgi:phenylpropionate dioxygenase-like ring-hydroxylating dioxygenase large terminal subunit
MLSKEDNELLTRVGPGTAMGNLLRQFWFPLVPSNEAPKAGARPLRLRLFGEDLVLFRNTEGTPGLLSEYCSHRGASLYHGRNEDGGLRCVYHGWAYDVAGRCIDMPNEPAGTTFKDKIKHPAYACREVNGTLWAYMGPRELPPPFPEYGLATLPEDHKAVRLTVRDCNWAQCLEGDLDLSHGGFLHSSLRTEFLTQNHLDRYTGQRPHMEALDTPYGVVHCVRRDHDDNHYHWGVGHFCFPFMTMFPPVGDSMEVVPGHIWIPMDDHTTLVWTYWWHPTKPLSAVSSGATLRASGQGPRDGMFDPDWEAYLPPTPEAGSQWRQKATRANDYGADDEAQRTRRYSGLPTVELQDKGIQESMRPIVDRTIEHLGTTDVAEIRVRQRLLNAARRLRDTGELPEAVDNPGVYRVRAGSGVLARNVPWVEGTAEWIQERPGQPVFSRGHQRPDFLRDCSVSAGT